MNFDTLFTALLKHEGGYVDAPFDAGGPTNKGITQRTLTSWLGRPATVEDVQNLSTSTAKTIYETRYYKGAGIGRLPDYLQPAMFDAAVNQGIRTAWRMLQLAANITAPVGLVVDGLPGSRTYAGVCACEDKKLLTEFIRQRMIRYQAIAAADRTQRRFLNGWLDRLDDFRVA